MNIIRQCYITVKCDLLLLKSCHNMYQNLLSGRLRELKNKGKDQLIIPKSGSGRLWERSLTIAFDYRV